MRELFFSHAIREAIEQEMERDERVILLGEDIAEYGGAFKLTEGIARRFGTERVRNTPISEGGFVGVSVGAALTGLRPVVEIMFMDFITLAMDQIANHAAKFRYQFGEQAKVPMVLRTPAGAGRGYGPTHSQSLEKWLVATPGLVVAAPATPVDAKGMLKSAIRCDDPVMFIESKILYGRRGDVPEGDYTVPLGEARIAREGADVTIVAYSRMSEEALTAGPGLAEHDIEAAVIDLRTLAPLDIETVTASVEETGRVVVVEEGDRRANRRGLFRLSAGPPDTGRRDGHSRTVKPSARAGRDAGLGGHRPSGSATGSRLLTRGARQGSPRTYAQRPAHTSWAFVVLERRSGRRRLLTDQPVEAQEKLVRSDRLRDEIVAPGLESRHAVMHRILSGDHDARRGGDLPQLAHQVRALKVGEKPVKENDIRLLAPGHREARLPVLSFDDLVVGTDEYCSECSDYGFIVVYDEYLFHSRPSRAKSSP